MVLDVVAVIIIIILVIALIRGGFIKKIENALMDSHKIEIDDYLYIIQLLEPAEFRDISDPQLQSVKLEPGIYKLICVPSPSNADNYFWAIAGEDEIGISPLDLRALIVAGKVQRLKKPKENKS